ncbi:polysaccharide deacetylase family protein [Longispora sp. K20-0274]|uniref:polysaccharide deacetylase family protein n=1 Tax=Longispora sp. K20-0274 TaxID=3088255 RepID=UPI003999E308
MLLRRALVALLSLPILAACAHSTAAWRDPKPPPPVVARTTPPPPVVRPEFNPNDTIKNTGGPDAALTFDDGPSPTYTPQILALLKKYGIKATFCLIGTEVQEYPTLVQAIVRDGHTLCNHSWHHELGLGSWSPDAIRANLSRTNDAIRRAAPGAQIRYYRQPGGAWTPTLIDVARSLGMRSLHWSVDTKDWTQPGADAIYTTVATQAGPGSIVLMHDAGGNRSGTLAACQRLFPQLKARITLVPMP